MINEIHTEEYLNDYWTTFFNGFLKSANDICTLWDSELNLLQINDKALSLFPEGTKREDLIGKHILELNPAMEDMGRYAEYKKVIKTGIQYETKDIIFPDQKDLLFHIKAFPIGKGMGMISTDISKQKKLTKLLSDNEKKLLKIVNKISDGIVIINAKGIIEFVNPAAEILYNRRSKELIGKYFDYPIENDIITDVQILKKDAGFRTVEIRSSAIKWDRKQATLISMRDMSVRKDLEEMLYSHQEHLRLINQILRHDLTNDLSVLKSAMRIYRDTRDEEIYDEATARITKSISLIRRMGKLETMVSSGSKLRLYNMHKVIDKIIPNFQDVNIELLGDGNALADESIYNIFENLIFNSKIHGKAKNIRIVIKHDESISKVTICDDGCGIAPEIKVKIFEKGFSSGKTGNTGMGLYIVKKTIESYGGSIVLAFIIISISSFHD